MAPRRPSASSPAAGKTRLAAAFEASPRRFLRRGGAGGEAELEGTSAGRGGGRNGGENRRPARLGFGRA
jgi:hypothetical protein